MMNINVVVNDDNLTNLIVVLDVLENGLLLGEDGIVGLELVLLKHLHSHRGRDVYNKRCFTSLEILYLSKPVNL